MDIGRKIKEALRASGVSQTDLANSLNVSRQQITNIVLGKSQPSVKILRRVIELTKKDANYFFGISDQKERLGDNNVIGNYNSNISQSVNTVFPNELEEIRNDLFLLKKAVRELFDKQK